MPAENVAKLNLPQSTHDLVARVSTTKRHPGLQLDKLSPVGDGNMENQRSALRHVTRTFQDKQLLKSLLAQRDNALKSLNARRLRMTTRGSLTLHLSRSGALENAGIALHPVYGFVYLPGSGIKGLVRSSAETVWAAAQSDKEKAWRKIEEAFGWGPQSERHKKGWRPSAIEAPKGAAAGRLVFHDAWPVRWPGLILDVVNNHHPKYYDGQDDPGDWEAPILVYFLAIGPDEEFEFALSDRTPTDDGLLDLAKGWLTAALTAEGAGAKTAAGYGRFKPVKGEAPIPKTLTSATYELRLASPAFLAGASQQEEDCDLRPATLRGLLRWWWRTMHAGHLNCCKLKQLETAVWGDAEAGSPVRIAVDWVEGGGPQKYNKHDSQFQKLPRPKSSQKVTQGLFYASYGMAEGRDRDRWRWYRPAGSCWRVTLTARSGRFNRVSLLPQQLLEQAAAAVWLFTQFGGAGSRARKGFGSFDDIEVQGIGSMDDCIKAAAHFRAACELNARQGRPVQAPALEEALIFEQPTAWRDHWYALDQTGMALQLFTKNLDAQERLALGLPRRVGRGRDAQPLRAGQIDRHASPALWSLATRGDGMLLVRLIAFPAAKLPEKAASKAILQNLIDAARKALNQQAGQSPRPSGRGGHGSAGTGRSDTRGSSGSAPPQGSPRDNLPRANERVQAELLEEKTKRGGWKAKHLDSGLEGPIQDKENAPANAKPGQPVTLTVAFVREREMAFRWAEPR